MSNPNNALGTNAAFNGRTSVNAFNDVLGAFTGRGVVSGWACTPSSGLTVTIGGNGTDRDVAIAEDSAGNRTTVNNISESPISVTMDSAPASNTRIDSIVAYIEASPQGDTTTDNPGVVNLLVVDGTASSTPSAPDDSAIRTAITTDGASGTTAYYVVLANITIANGTTDIDASMISVCAIAQAKLASGSVTATQLDFTTLPGNYSTSEINTGYTWLNGNKIYKKTIEFGKAPNNTTKNVAHGITNLGTVIKFEGYGYSSGSGKYAPIPWAPSSSNSMMDMSVDTTNISMTSSNDRSAWSFTITLYYTKTS